MSESALPPEILGLPIPDRIALAERIWESIAEDESRFVLTEAQKAELDRRLEWRASADSESSSWADAKKRIIGDS